MPKDPLTCSFHYRDGIRCGAKAEFSAVPVVALKQKMVGYCAIHLPVYLLTNVNLTYTVKRLVSRRE